MLVEPPRADVPAGAGLTFPASTTVRLGAGAAALLLAVLSRGDVLVLALLLATVAWRPLALTALAPALLAGGWRWGSTALEAIAGAQAVLGPAGTVGDLADAASAWLAAFAVVLITPDLRASPAARLLVGAAAGASAAAIVAGPAPGGALWARLVGTILATLAALAVAGARGRARSGRGRPAGVLLDAGAIAGGVAALLLVATSGPPWAGTLDTGSAGTGAALAVAASAVVVGLLTAVPALRHERSRLGFRD